MLSQVAELEISIRRGRDDGYDAELRFTGPEDAADTRSGGSTLAEASLAELRGMDPTSEAYGTRLFASVFSDPAVLAPFREAMTVAEAGEADLRVRLMVDPAAPELQRLRWEAMRDTTGALLFTGERVYFSRYISTSVYRALRRRTRGELRALAAIASPVDLGEEDSPGGALPPLDVPGEEARIRAAFQGTIPVEVLRSGSAPHVTLDRILDALRAAPADVLYLACHGTLQNGTPHLWLEQPLDGTAHVVPGVELVRRLAEMRNRPSLVVLASCQSAGTGNDGATGDGGVMAALGPRLAEAGIPAVLAMQGNVSMATVKAFMPAFFGSLARDGLLDRAAALARGATRDRPDAWVPVLFMRLKGGGIWYERGFEDDDGFQRWDAIVDSITAGTCTPLLGPGLVEAYVGTRRELARELADAYDFPLARHEREELPQVAQYVAVEHGKALADRRIVSLMCEQVQARYREALTPEARDVVVRNEQAPRQARWHDELMRQAWRQRVASEPPEPHQALALMPFPLYLSTNVDALMGEALAPARPPVVELCRWNDATAAESSVFDEDPKRAFEPGAPLVYHLFGKVDVQDSLVTTQDDYFDSLLATAGRKLLPQAVRKALTNTSLLFIGFQIEDWNFRVLFRSVMNLEGSRALRGHPHVAVQIDPDEQRFHNPRAARRYLARYFGTAEVSISIYWGSAEDFARELLQRYQLAHPPAPTPAGRP
jgi:hypothetical protein